MDADYEENLRNQNIAWFPKKKRRRPSRFALALAKKKPVFDPGKEMQHADWLICLVWIQDGGITTNLLRDKLRV